MKSLNVNGIHLSNVKPLQVMRNFVGPWCNGTRCGMRIPRPGFNSQQIIPPNQDSPVNWNSPSPCELLLRRMSSLLTQRRYMDVGTTVCFILSYDGCTLTLNHLRKYIHSINFYILNTGIVVLSEFGFSKRNPYVSMLVLLSMLVSFFVFSVIVLEVKYSKRKWDKLKKSYWQAIRQSISRYVFQISNLYNLDTHNMHYL